MPDHIILNHFHLGLSKEAADYLDISSGGSFKQITISEGKAILKKIHENTPYTDIYDESPKEIMESSPDQEKEVLATVSKIPLNPSHEPVADEPLIKGMHQTQEDDEPHPSSFPFEFEEDLFEDFGNASNFPVQVRPLVHPAPIEDDGPHSEPFLLEHIKGLSAIMSREWSAEAELSTEVAQIIAPSDVLPCVLKETILEACNCSTIGMNIIPNVLAEMLCPNESVIPSHKLLKIPT